MMTNQTDERPEVDKCADGDCFLCHPRTDVELEAFGELKIAGHGTLSREAALQGRAMPSGTKDASD